GDNLTGWLKFNQTGPQAPNQKCCEVLNASRFFHCVRGTWRSAEAFGLYLVAAGGCKACAARACLGETQACELSGGPSSISQETQVRRDPGATGARASRQGKSVRHPKTRRAAPALWPAARARRGDEELGGHPRPESRAGREAPCNPRGRSSDRIQRLRGNHPGGGVWRRHRHDLGSRPLVPGGRPARGLQERSSRLRLGGREAAWAMASRAHARQGRGEEGAMASDQIEGRGIARRE